MSVKTINGVVLPIQYLRGIAAMMVVFHHIKIQIPNFESYLPGSFGASGVDIFFVISGFIMYITTANSTMGSIEFMMRRIIRVVPLYWLLTSLMCLIWIVVPSLFKTLIVTPTTFIQSLFFIPHYSLSFPTQIFPLLVPGWTLNFEMFYYAVFAMTLLLPKFFLAQVVSLLMLLLVLVGTAFGPFDTPVIATYTSPLLLEFVAGVLLGKLWLCHRRGFTTMMGVALFVLGWVILVGNSIFLIGKYCDIVGAALIVGGALNSAFLAWKNRVFKLLGDATYAIYLSHIFALGGFRVFWARFFDTDGNSLNAISFAISAMLVCLVVGVLLYKYLESPLTRYLNGVYRRRSLKIVAP